MFLLLLTGCGRAVSTIGFAGSVACDHDNPYAGFESTLTPAGCHFLVSGTNPDGTMRLELDVPAFVELSQGTAVSTSYTLPDSGVRLEVDAGCRLDACDGGDSGGPLVDSTWDATAGTVAIEGTPGESGTATATVTLTGVTFSDGAGSEVTVESVTWTDVALTLD